MKILVKHKMDWGESINLVVNEMCTHDDYDFEVATIDADYYESSESCVLTCNNLNCSAWRDYDSQSGWNDEGWFDEEVMESFYEPKITNGKLVLQ